MMTRLFRWRCAAVATAMLGALASSAVAQEQMGPQVVPGWSFTPAVSLGMTYDSNVSLSDAPASTGKTPSDRLFVLQPSGRLTFQGPRTLFSSGYQGRFRRYATLDELNNLEQRADGSLRYLVSERLTVFFNNDFARVPTTDDVELNGTPYSRTGTRTNRFAAGFTERLSELMDVSVRYENTWVDFDESVEADTFLTGGLLHAVRGELSRRISPRASVGASYAFRTANMNEGARSMNFHDAGGVLNVALGPTTNFSLSGGVSRLLDRTLDVTRTGPFFRASLTHELPRATVGAAFDRAMVPSFGFGGSSASQELSGFVRVPIGSNRLYVQGTGAWRRTDPLIESSLELDTLRLRTTVGYSMTRWLHGEALYSYSRQDSIVTGGEIDRHRVGVQLVLSQPVRIR